MHLFAAHPFPYPFIHPSIQTPPIHHPSVHPPIYPCVYPLRYHPLNLPPMHPSSILPPICASAYQLPIHSSSTRPSSQQVHKHVQDCREDWSWSWRWRCQRACSRVSAAAESTVPPCGPHVCKGGRPDWEAVFCGCALGFLGSSAVSPCFGFCAFPLRTYRGKASSLVCDPPIPAWLPFKTCKAKALTPNLPALHLAGLPPGALPPRTDACGTGTCSRRQEPGSRA